MTPPVLVTAISPERLGHLSWNFGIVSNYVRPTYCKNISEIGDVRWATLVVAYVQCLLDETFRMRDGTSIHNLFVKFSTIDFLIDRVITMTRLIDRRDRQISHRLILFYGMWWRAVCIQQNLKISDTIRRYCHRYAKLTSQCMS